MFDKRFFELEDNGTKYKCAIKANGLGYLCGYVFVPEDHPKHGTSLENDIFVHGGITFCDTTLPGYPEQPKGTWIGFDCAHFGDRQDPEYIKLNPNRTIDTSSHGSFKDEYFVTKEIKSMIRQLESIPNMELDLPL